MLSKDECRRFLRAVDLRPQPPLDWEKGLAPASRADFEVATQPAILDVVSQLLGSDVILWGASIQRRWSKAVHAWHSDIETSDPACRTVSVWIGLERTTPASSLLVLSGSHPASASPCSRAATSRRAIATRSTWTSSSVGRANGTAGASSSGFD